MEIMSTKKYKDDYEMVVTQDEQGREKMKPVYRGDYFEVSLDEKGLLQFRRSCFLLVAAIVVLHVSSGFINNPGMYQFYISLPYVFVYLPLFYLAWGVMYLPIEKREYRRDEIGLSFNRMNTASKFLLILFGMGVLGEIIFLLFFSVQGNGALEYLYLSLEALATVAAYFLMLLQKPILIKIITDQSSVE